MCEIFDQDCKVTLRQAGYILPYFVLFYFICLGFVMLSSECKVILQKLITKMFGELRRASSSELCCPMVNGASSFCMPFSL